MTRSAANFSQDEIARIIRAVKGVGLRINRVALDKGRVEIIVGDGEAVAEVTPDNLESLDEYKAWRDRKRESEAKRRS